MYRKNKGGGFDHAPGLSAAEIRGRFAGYDTERLPQTGCWNGPATGKETDAEIAERVEAASAWVKSHEVWDMVEGGARPLVLVMHSDFIDLLVKALLQLPPGANGYFAHDNCSLTEVWLPRSLCSGGKGAATLRYLNRVDHLQLSAL
mmetsp:Transcript_61922/g.146750  ORF Transcript_61922/g.146750 Transcript_61922/m.146750 type:complete len:147 (+) Transcript_61922:2-442(+)